MMEKMKGIISRLATDPQTIAAMIIQRSAASDELHLQLDIIQEREVKIVGQVADRRKGDGSPVFPNRELREAEAQRILETDTDFIAAKNNADVARRELRQLDAAIESATRRNNSDQTIVNLITALLNTGKYQEVNEVVSVYQACGGVTNNSGIQQKTIQETQNQTTPINTTNNVETGTVAVVTILEVRTTKPGTVRAYCQAEDGSKVPVFAKNGNAQALLGATGRKVVIKYQTVDRGWFAYEVQLVA